MRDFSNVRNDNFFVDLSRHERLMARMKSVTGWNKSVHDSKSSAALLYDKLYRKAENSPAAQSVLIAIASTLKTRIELPNGRFAGPPEREPIAA